MKVILGIKEREIEATICGPVRTSDILDLCLKKVFVRTVLIRVKGERQLREIDFDRILAILSPTLAPVRRRA